MNVAVQVTFGSQSLVTVKVIDADPPHAFGAVVLLLLIIPLQPPVNMAVPNQVLNLASIADWLWQAASVAFVGQVNITTGAGVTVNVAVQVTFGSQSLVTVKVMDADPPHAFGAVVLLLLIIPLHPPVNIAVPNHVLNLASIADWL